MFLTDLDTVVRTSGLQVIESFGWQSRGHGGMVATRGIVCHHTVGPPTGDFPSLAVVRDGRSDLPGPLAQLGLARSGTVWIIAAGLSWHAGEGSWPGLSGNSDCIGIEAESTGDGTDWTAAQRDAYPRLCAALCRGYGIDPALVIAHREWAPTRKIDPAGINMPVLRDTVRSILAGGGEGGGDPIDPPGDDMFEPNDREEAAITRGKVEATFNQAAAALAAATDAAKPYLIVHADGETAQYLVRDGGLQHLDLAVYDDLRTRGLARLETVSAETLAALLNPVLAEA